MKTRFALYAESGSAQGIGKTFAAAVGAESDIRFVMVASTQFSSVLGPVAKYLGQLKVGPSSFDEWKKREEARKKE